MSVMAGTKPVASLQGLRIWGRRAAFNVQKVLWCVHELGLAHEQIDAGQHYGKNKEPFFLAMNPNGRVPVLQLDDFVLWESGAIIRFLCAQAGTGALSPTATAQWAHADQWMDWVTGTLYYPTFRNYYLYQTRTAPDAKDPEQVERMRQDVFEILRIAEQHLSRNRYIAGDALSMADFAFGVVVDKWIRIEEQVPDFPGLARYHETLKRRPHFLKHVFSHALTAV